MPTSTLPRGYRFGTFTLDLRSSELSENGRRIHLQEKPCLLLTAFTERPGEVITRGELRERLWPHDTFVDFEDGLNTAMRKLREALQDDPQSPRYIETVRGRGYRFLAQVEPFAPPPRIRGADTAVDSAMNGVGLEPDSSPGERTPGVPAGTRSNRSLVVWSFLFGCTLAVGAAGGWYWLAYGHPVLSFRRRGPVLIADFDNQTGDPRFDNALGTALTVSLEESQYVNIYSRLQAANALRLMTRKESDRITPAVGREICQRENIPALVAPGITRAGRNYLLTAQLFDPSSGAVLRSYAEEARGEDEILPALDAISAKIRRDLGESRYAIHKSRQPLPQVTTASLQALKDYADGGEMFGRGNADQAVQLYKEAIAADPGFAIAHAALGYAYASFYLHQPEDGEREFRAALALSTRTTDRERSWIEMRYAESEGRIGEAMDLYRSYLRQYPDDWLAQDSYARLLRMHGHTAEAAGIYRRMIQESPDDARIDTELALAEYELGQWPQSVQTYEKAFSLDPQRLMDMNTNSEYGIALIQVGQDRKAAEVFSRLLTQPGSFAHGERFLAFLDLYHGQYASARQRLLLALSRTRDPFSVARIRYMLAVVAAGQGNRREQLAQLDAIMANFHNLQQKVLYGCLLGQAYARAGEEAEAKKILAAIAPMVNERVEDQAAYVEILKAEVAAGAGDFATAIQFLKPPQTSDESSTAVLTRESFAHLYQQMGDQEDAIDWYRQFLNPGRLGAFGWELQQQIFTAWYTLAADYARKGNRAQAMSVLDELLNRWNGADSGLPLLHDARHLQDELIARN